MVGPSLPLLRRYLVLFVGRLLLRECLRRDVVLWWVFSLLMVHPGLQGFPPGQASATSSFSLERISERNVEQIAGFSRGGLQDFLPGQISTSSSHDPARASDALDAPGKGFFLAFFLLIKKSAKLASHLESALLPESSPSTPAAQLAFLLSCSLQAQAEEKRRKEEEEQLAKEKEEAEGDVSAACSAVPAAGADALPPRHLGTVFRVHVAGGVIKGDDGRMFPFRSSCMELAVGYRVSFFVRGLAACGLTRVF